MNILQKTIAIAYCILLCGITLQPLQAENTQPLRPREYHIGDRYYYLDTYTGRGDIGSRKEMYFEEVLGTQEFEGKTYFVIGFSQTLPVNGLNAWIRYERSDETGMYLYDTERKKEVLGYSHLPPENKEERIPIPKPFSEIIARQNDTTLWYSTTLKVGVPSRVEGRTDSVRALYYFNGFPHCLIRYAEGWGVVYASQSISPGVNPVRTVVLRGAIRQGVIYGDTLRIPEMPPRYVSRDSIYAHGVAKDLTIGNEWYVQYISIEAIDTTAPAYRLGYDTSRIWSIEQAVRTQEVNGKMYTVINCSHDGSERLERVEGLKLFMLENGEEKLVVDMSKETLERADTSLKLFYRGHQRWEWKELGKEARIPPEYDEYKPDRMYGGLRGRYSIDSAWQDMEATSYLRGSTFFVTPIGMLSSGYYRTRRPEGDNIEFHSMGVAGCRLQGVLYGTLPPITSVAEKGAVGSNAALRIRVVPNPVAGGNAVTVQIQGGNEGHYDIELVSITGEVLYQHNGIMGNEGTGTAILPITEVASGRYIIRVRDSKGVVGSTTMIRTR